MKNAQCVARPSVLGEGVTVLKVAAAAASVGAARDWVVRWFEAQGLDWASADAAELVASELVTNAYRHGSRAGDGIVVRLFRCAGGAALEVRDTSAEPPVVRRPGPEATGGRGLALVGLLAAAWGAEPLASGGKVVWAVLRAVPDPACAAGGPPS
ncbi:ATP-binding protein [Actinomadura parmotrematis]|uniref:ATP-binding protein n=1 Tax=Actinomadura parmotrematis TaxID=2864039 RepID=A0ABS7FSN1_9ACTN|nr:ATP-binding protein [Actinomadura parmotrematis]MBW8482970.1 ATP-binding protein [Actinomadura parmotrematis]